MFFKLSLLLFLFVCLAEHINAQTQAEQELINQLFNNGQYDRRVRPVNGAEKQGPVAVTVNMYLRNVDVLDNNEFHVQLTFRQMWQDDRLVYKPDKTIRYLSLVSPENLIWTPDTFFSNEKESHFHNLLTRNQYLRVFPDGNVLHSVRISLKLACPMDFRNFPFDTQICPIRMASYGYTNKDIVYKWKKSDPVQVAPTLLFRFHSLQSFTTDYCDSSTNTGTYSCLTVGFNLKRAFSPYLINIYIPCVMFVILAYLSFWINVRALTARTILLVTTLVVFAIQTSNINKTLPQTGYTKAVDWWTGICLTFVFVVLVEFIKVQYIAKREEQRSQTTGSDEESVVPLKDQSKIKCAIQKYIKGGNSLSDKLDVACRLLFPITFIIIVVAYSITYSSTSSDVHCVHKPKNHLNFSNVFDFDAVLPKSIQTSDTEQLCN